MYTFSRIKNERICIESISSADRREAPALEDPAQLFERRKGVCLKSVVKVSCVALAIFLLMSFAQSCLVGKDVGRELRSRNGTLSDDSAYCLSDAQIASCLKTQTIARDRGYSDEIFCFPTAEVLKVKLSEHPMLKPTKQNYFLTEKISQAISELAAERFGSSAKVELSIKYEVHLMMYDFQKGVDGFNGKPLLQFQLDPVKSGLLRLSIEGAVRDCGKKMG